MGMYGCQGNRAKVLIDVTAGKSNKMCTGLYSLLTLSQTAKTVLHSATG